jgi:pre-mRNA-splicing helicase BRR2
MVKGALDEIIALLKTDIKDSERRSEIEGMVDKISDTDFNSLTVLC